eukprot:3701800-Pleurochrysis_carterae.AAC.1
MAKRGSIGLLEALNRVSINLRKYDAKWSCLTAAEAEQQLLLPWDAVTFEMSIFEAIMTLSSSLSSSAAAAAGSTAGSEGSYAALLRHLNTLRFQ